MYSVPGPDPATCGISWLRAAPLWIQGLCGQHFYLAYLASALVILFIWLQFVHASLNVIWPLSLVQAGLVFSLACVEVFALREIRSLPLWFIWMGVAGIIGGVIRLRNLMLVTPRDADTLSGTQDSM